MAKQRDIGRKARRARTTYNQKMAAAGYLPAGFFADPKEYELNRKQKERLSRMMSPKKMGAARFKVTYGFNRLKVKKK